MSKRVEPRGHRARVKARGPVQAPMGEETVAAKVARLNRLASKWEWPVHVEIESASYRRELLQTQAELDGHRRRLVDTTTPRIVELETQERQILAILERLERKGPRILFMSTDADGRNRKERRAAKRHYRYVEARAIRAYFEGRGRYGREWSDLDLDDVLEGRAAGRRV